jgi:hypothetical protein
MAQRSALTLPKTGFATTTDIQRALHPPDKQVRTGAGGDHEIAKM